MFVNNFVNRLTEFIQPLEIVYIAKILNEGGVSVGFYNDNETLLTMLLND